MPFVVAPPPFSDGAYNAQCVPALAGGFGEAFMAGYTASLAAVAMETRTLTSDETAFRDMTRLVSRLHFKAQARRSMDRYMASKVCVWVG